MCGGREVRNKELEEYVQRKKRKKRERKKKEKCFFF